MYEKLRADGVIKVFIWELLYVVGKRSGGPANVAPQRHDGVQRRRRLGGGKDGSWCNLVARRLPCLVPAKSGWVLVV